MEMNFEGRVWKFGDDIDTDAIIPARFLNVWKEDVLATNCFVDLRPDFSRGVQPGDIIVAGTNFGCGSSREHAPRAIKALGISMIIARSFARIFFRNALNIGLPSLESEDAVGAFSEGDRVAVDLGSGEIKVVDDEQVFFARPVPGFMREILQAGGLVNYVKEKGAI